MNPLPTSTLNEETRGSTAFKVGSSLLILLFLAINAARIASVAADHGETPFLSANDRSRWCAIAALLEDHSFAIDRFLEKRDSKGKTRTWYSIDMVRHQDDQEIERFYSSKPPLLTVAYAAGTWPAMVVFQKRLSEYPLLIGRSALLIINLLPSLIFLLWWRRVISRDVYGDWAKWMLLIAGLFATFLTTFVVTLNNHLHAAICVVVTMILLSRILRLRVGEATQQHSNSIRQMLIALGSVAGCCVMCDLPALSWAGIVPWIIVTKSKWFHDWTFYSIGLFPVLAAIVGVNWYAHGDWRPPYYHREYLGEQLLSVSSEQSVAPKSSNNNLHNLGDSELLSLSAAFDDAAIKQKLGVQSPIRVERARRSNTLRLLGKDTNDPNLEKRFAIVFESNSWSIHRWNDWYDYPRSYWLPENKRGVDLGEPSRVVYAWNCLFGHHGVFSLTPIFCLSIAGAIVAVRTSSQATRRLAWGIIVVSIVCMAFYLTRSQLDRNYGGVASGFRWQFWLIPTWLWLASQLYTQEASVWGTNPLVRRLTELALAISIFSAWYPAANPWQHPWMYQLFLWMYS